MWFYAEINRNPEPLIGVVSNEDVLRIARIIKKDDDEYICSRISFELTLDNSLGENFENKEPILAKVLDVIGETFLSNKKDTIQKTNFKNLLVHLSKAHNLIEDKNTHDLIVSSENLSVDDLKHFKEISALIQNTLDGFLHNSHKYRKKLNKGWGTLGRYTDFLKECAILYTELTGHDFTAHFNRDNAKGICEPLTEGTLFLYEFHKILNNISNIYSCKVFTDNNFASACNAIPKKSNKKKTIK